MPAIAATWEAEAELLESGRWRLRLAKIAPLHSSLGNKSETTHTHTHTRGGGRKREKLEKEKYTIEPYVLNC